MTTVIFKNESPDYVVDRIEMCPPPVVGDVVMLTRQEVPFDVVGLWEDEATGIVFAYVDGWLSVDMDGWEDEAHD